MAIQEDAWSRADWINTARNGARQSGPGMSVLTGEDLARYCFGDISNLPKWLLNPGDTLQAAADPSQRLDRQLACLLQMMNEVDMAFSQHLAEGTAAQKGAGGVSLETVPSAAPSPVSSHVLQMLPRWIDALFAGGAALLRRQIMPQLATSGLRIMPATQLDESQRAWLHRYFMQRIYPLLTPLAVDSGHPFPFISSDSVNLLVELRPLQVQNGHPLGLQKQLLARVKIPTTTPRWIPVPPPDAAEGGRPEEPGAAQEAMHRPYWSAAKDNGAHAQGRNGLGRNGTSPRANLRGGAGKRDGGSHHAPPQIYVATADVVRFFVHHLFTGMTVRHVWLFRLVRADLRMGPPATSAPQPEVSPRRRQIEQPAARLDVERRMPEPLLEWLLGHVRLPSYAVARHDNLLEWLSLSHLAAHVIDGLPSPLPEAGQIPHVD